MYVLQKDAETVQFEMDEAQMSSVLNSLKAVSKSIEAFQQTQDPTN